MQYPRTLEELERVLVVDFRFDRGHDYRVSDGKITWLGIDRSVIPLLEARIGPAWEVKVHRSVEHGSDVFCRVDIVPKDARR